ncbi:MAG: TetR/AcrR family transcriptional regulator [Deltaproteobacteria bacterium]|nr:TetR/AcrR family transcriptional regulator [Deltaproteobacteria bacterium]
MNDQAEKTPHGKRTGSGKNIGRPPGKIKIAEAFKLLIAQKDFNAITTAEIAKASGCNESLIYRYFGDKRGIMHQLFLDIFQNYLKTLRKDLRKTEGNFNKLRFFIKSHVGLYHSDYALARIALLEVRNFPRYFESETYALVKQYSCILTGILDEGIKNREIRNDIPINDLRQAVFGVIEHMCLPKIIYHKVYSVDQLSDHACAILFEGIMSRK